MASKVIGRVEIKVAARVDNSRPNMQREMDRDLDRMQRRAERRRPIKIPVDLDDRELRRKLDRLHRDGDGRDKELFKVVADFDYSKVKQGTERMRKELKSVERAKVKMELDKGAFDQRLKQLNRNLRVKAGVEVNEEDLRNAKGRLDRFRHDAQKKIEMPVGLSGLGLAAARLSWLTRPRRVSIIATVNAKSAVVALGMLKSLAGINTLRKFGENLEDIITDFDRFAYGITKVLTLVGSLSNGLGYMATSLVSIGGGIAQIGQLSAILPTLAASAFSVFGVLRIGFNNFAESFSDIPDVAEAALKKLPPVARRARDALVGVFRGFQDPIQDLFWENIGDGVERFALVVVPRVQAGLLKITPAVAKMTRAVVDSFEEMASNKSMDIMFDNLAAGLRNMTRGVKPFFDALNTLGFRGSFFLERIGTGLANMAEDFNEFIQHAEKMGHIEGWINTGWKALKDFGGTILAVKDQFKALTQIIDAAGGQSLAGFRRNMEGWARAMEQEPFRSNMVRMFRGARDGASELAEGIRTLARVFGDSSHQVEALEIQLGRVGRGALERISDILGRRMLHAGLLSGLLNVEEALRRIKPSAQAIGDVLGVMFDVAGHVLVGVTPMLNQVTDILRTIALQLGPSLKDTIPTLAQFLRGIIELGGGSLQLVTTVLTGVLNVVNALPGPLQSLVLAFGTFLALRGRLGGMMSALDMFWNRQRTSFAGGVAVVESNAQKFARSYDRVVSSVERGGTRIGNALRTGGLHMIYGTGARFEREFAQMTAAANKGASGMRGAVGRIGGAVKGLGTALSGIMAFGGGLGGMLVFTGLIAAISAIGQAAAKEKERIRDLQSTLDEFGNATDDTRKKVAEFLQDAPGRGGNLIKTFEDLGIAASDVVEAMTGSDEQFDSFYRGLENGLADTTKKLQDYEAAAVRAGKTAGEMHNEEYFALVNKQQGYEMALKGVREYDRSISQAKTRQQEIAKAMGTTSAEAKALDDAIRTIGSEYASAADKATAMSRAIDVLNGSLSSQNDAAIAAADAVRNIRETLKGLGKSEKLKLEDMIDIGTGKIDFSISADPSGLFAKMHQQMKTAVEGGISIGMEAAASGPANTSAIRFKAAYEKQLRNLRAEIEPSLDPNPTKARQKFDAWLKHNKWDEATITALVEGKLDKGQLAQLPPEVKALFEQHFGKDPAKIQLDGDVLPLEGKMNVATGMLEKLGATKTTPKIDGDGRPLDKTTTDAVNKLREIEGMDVQAILDADDLGLSKKQQEALRKLYEIDSFEAIPQFDANGQPLDAETRLAMAKILGLDGKEAEAFLKADSAQLQTEVANADQKLDTVKQDTPAPIQATGKQLAGEVGTAQERINGIKQRSPVEIGADGRNARQEGESTQQYINRMRQARAIPIDANGKPAKQAANDTKRAIDGVKQGRKPPIDANEAPAKRAAANAASALKGVPNVTRRIVANTLGLGNVQTLLWTVNALKSKTITVTTNYAQRGAGPTKKTALADGGIMGRPSRYGPLRTAHTFFASGGFSKPTRAHIAPGGSYVTYAEKETGGEAFIPLASSKRARSTKILGEVARMFGYDLNRKFMANGGINGGNTVTRSSDVTIGQLIAADPEEAVRLIRDAQRQAQALLNIGGGL